MKIIKTTLLALTATFALASCDSDTKEVVQYGYDSDITYVTDYATNTSVSTTGAAYTMEFDLVNAKASVEIKNLRVSEDASPITLRIEQAAFGYSSETGATVINLPNAVSVVDGVSHTISNFKLSQTMAYITALGNTATYYSISFELDNQYSIIAVQRGAYLPGTTVITDAADGTVVETTSRPYYFYALDQKEGTATITVNGIKVDDVTYNELRFDNLPYTLTPGGIRINVDEDVTAKQLTSTGKPFVAKAISMDSHYDGATQIRILTDNNLITASLSYRVQSSTEK
ncbi:MAG: hypothetical protein K2L73_01385 [Muribaculaceae bacterium]|nr:hypothetical protein [Muribaculaceae bacterium]